MTEERRRWGTSGLSQWREQRSSKKGREERTDRDGERGEDLSGEGGVDGIGGDIGGLDTSGELGDHEDDGGGSVRGEEGAGGAVYYDFGADVESLCGVLVGEVPGGGVGFEEVVDKDLSRGVADGDDDSVLGNGEVGDETGEGDLEGRENAKWVERVSTEKAHEGRTGSAGAPHGRASRGSTTACARGVRRDEGPSNRERR